MLSLSIRVTKPLQKLKNFLGSSEDFNTHQNTKYHQEAVLKSRNFINNYETWKKYIKPSKYSMYENNRRKLEQEYIPFIHFYF